MKPEYQVPSMEEIKAIPWNGYTVISTFSGAGGSSLGYRMAGFRVLWASEFIDAARETYNANKTNTVVDGRDIRDVTPESIMDAVGLKPGNLDLLDGSPPCASFSTAGRRAASWGKVKKYSEKSQRTDDLFFEYSRLIRGLRPKAFVAENVSGLVKGVAKGYFKRILAELKSCGYRVTCRVLDAQWLGVPQSRQRTIFIGVREDLGIDPVHPKPLPYRYSVRDALPWIKEVRQIEVYNEPDRVCKNLPCPTITNSGIGAKRIEKHFVEAETDISRYAIGAEWDRLAQGQKSEKYLSLIKPSIDKPSPTITQLAGVTSIADVVHPLERRKFSIEELKRICAFPDDFILTGTYSQQWERLGRAVPPVMMFHIAATIRDKILMRES